MLKHMLLCFSLQFFSSGEFVSFGFSDIPTDLRVSVGQTGMDKEDHSGVCLMFQSVQKTHHPQCGVH